MVGQEEVVGVSRTFYRLHHRNKPWVANPTSQEFAQTGFDQVRRRVGEEAPGYSAFENPWHLFDYITRRRWRYDEDDVVAFTGTEVGKGVDGEPLVLPEGLPTRRWRWEDFARWVVKQPMGSPPPGGAYGPWGDVRRYLDATVKTYDTDIWSRLTGITEVYIGRTKDYPDHPTLRPVWWVRKATPLGPHGEILIGGLPTEADAREYCRTHDLTIVGKPITAALDKEADMARTAPLEPVEAKSGEDYADYAMIALRPPEEVVKAIVDMDECTEKAEDIHLTLIYLGTKEEAGGPWGEERLYRGCYDFALHSGYRGLTAKMNGFGVFQNDDADVLVSLWDIPGIAEFRTRLKRYLTDHGATLREDDHGFTPHVTLAYSEDSVRRVPSVPRPLRDEPIIFGSFWLVWGEEWTEISLP